MAGVNRETLRKVDDKFLADFGDILEWAAEQGISRHTRFHHYKKNIEWLRDNDKPEDRARLHFRLLSEERLTEMLSTMTESIELVETVSTLRRCSIEVPKLLLQRVFSGPVDAFQEDHTSNEARNAMFELCMGAMAARANLEPTMGIGNPDLSFGFEGRRVKIECKRVISETAVLRRLREGINQLQKSVCCAGADIGIVAISISKLINPGDKFLISQTPFDDLSEELCSALAKNEQLLGRMRRPAVAGFLFYVSTAAYVPDNGYTPVSCGTVFPVNFTEIDYLRKLAGALWV